jgi:glycine/D-amino acid oxidase-like deaminating enzyme
MQRRQFLRGSAALLSTATAGGTLAADTPALDGPAASLQSDELPLAPIRASADRLIEMNVCTRPFRPQGPRIELERIGRRQVVHNYGHGGSGWSLSWGSGLLATQLAKSTGAQRIAIVGCGAIGLTTALVALQAGLQVTIYASERPPHVRSQFATGSWTPDSRICTAEFAAPFAERWEAMARYSFRRYQALLGVAGDPVEWRDMYSLSDRAPARPAVQHCELLPPAAGGVPQRRRPHRDADPG